jgi:hypothetical protein
MTSDQHHDKKHLETLQDHEHGSLSPSQIAEPAKLNPAGDNPDSITASTPTQLEQYPHTRKSFSLASPDDTRTAIESVNVS